MRLLLTAGGVTNAGIRDALIDLLGKPIAESTALCIPTAQWGHPMCGPLSARGFVVGNPPWHTMSGLGWKSLGLLELTALPTIGQERWVPWVREADALLVDGGDATYLCHWMRASGLADLLPSLSETVWVGVSAGSMVMTRRIGDYFVEWPSAPDDKTLGVVDFSIFPHLDHEMLPGNTLADAERWAADIGCPAYAMDDATALKVVDGVVEVVSEGQWKWYAKDNAMKANDSQHSEQFYHGTKADLKPGDLIEPGYSSNYGKRKKAAFVYLTATLDAATWGAELALGDGPGRIYCVEPTGPIEDDPNLTDKKFPGNPTKSYRSRHPLRVTGEVTDWQGHPPEQLQAMKEHLERLKQMGIEAIEE